MIPTTLHYYYFRNMTVWAIITRFQYLKFMIIHASGLSLYILTTMNQAKRSSNLTCRCVLVKHTDNESEATEIT